MLLRSLPRPSAVFLPLLLLSLLASFLIIHQLRDIAGRIEGALTQSVQKFDVTPETSHRSKEPRRTAWIDGHGSNLDTGYMRHIFDAFRSFGYDIITGCPPPHDDWDVLWQHEYSLSKCSAPCHYDRVQNARWPQAVNHVPGSGYYTSKVYLATANLSLGVPLAFKMPEQAGAFREYAKENPDVLWVQKDNSHRNIKIKSVSDVDTAQSSSFVQKFVDKPLLIDNRKFDLGIYTVVTSLEPLRVYTFEDVLIRFCPKDYLPFDSADVDTYVVGDDYTPIWEIPSLIDVYEKKRLSVKQILNEYCRQKGIDGSKIWTQIDRVIAEVFQSHQKKMLSSRASSPSDSKFFELSRFDFVVDEDLNVFLMEANMSPNLSSGHFKQNQLLYEQVLMSVLSLVGLASPFTKQTEWDYRLGPSSTECALCGHCLVKDEDLQDALGEVYREHLEKRKMRRLRVEDTGKEPLTCNDRLLWRWLSAKCEENSQWC